MALGEPLSYVCVNLSAMLSFKHQILFTVMRGVVDLTMIIPTLSGFINSSAAVSQVSSEMCPWVLTLVSCTTPGFLYQPEKVVCSAGHAPYNLTAIAIIIGHLPPLLVCYWYELRLKLAFLMSAEGGAARARLPHPDSMPLVLTLQLAAGLAAASLLAAHMAVQARALGAPPLQP